MIIYKAEFYPEDWNEKETIGYFRSKEEAWLGCFKHHPIYKESRFLWRGQKGWWRYNFHYKDYYIKEIEVE